jgi:hypothetical protein
MCIRDRFLSIPIGEDSLFMLEIYTKKPILQYVPYLGYYYHQHPSSAMHDLTEEKINSNFTFLQRGRSLLLENGLWDIAGSYWKSRAKTNSIERFQQIKSHRLRVFWRQQFVLFLKSDFFDKGLLKQCVIAGFKVVPLFFLRWTFTMRSTILDIARFCVNQKNSILRKLSDRI